MGIKVNVLEKQTALPSSRKWTRGTALLFVKAVALYSPPLGSASQIRRQATRRDLSENARPQKSELGGLSGRKKTSPC